MALRGAWLFLTAILVLAGCFSQPAAVLVSQDSTQPAEPNQPGQSQTQTAQEPPKAAEPPPSGPVYYVTDIFTVATKDESAKGKKVVMLTFDDGPSKEATADILDILKEHNVKALFLVTGYGAKNEDLVKRIVAEGHTIGTHTETHANLTKLSREQARKEIVSVNETVERLTGVKPKYFRPPFGAYNQMVEGLLSELRMTWFNWSVGSLDWETSDPDQVVRNVVDHIHPGGNVLLHDTHKHTARALPRILNELKQRGYEFVILP